MKGFIAVTDDLGMWYCQEVDDIHKPEYADMYKHPHIAVVRNYVDYKNEEEDKRYAKPVSVKPH